MYYILWVIGKEIGHIDLGHIESPGFPLHLSYITAVLFSPVYALPLHNPWSQGEGDGVFTILSTVTNNLVFFFVPNLIGISQIHVEPRGLLLPECTCIPEEEGRPNWSAWLSGLKSSPVCLQLEAAVTC